MLWIFAINIDISKEFPITSKIKLKIAYIVFKVTFFYNLFENLSFLGRS